MNFVQNGKRWFDGKIINQNFEDVNNETFGYLYDKSLSSDEDSDDEKESDSSDIRLLSESRYSLGIKGR